MTTIHIAASREYDVVIEPGLLTRLGTMAAELGLGRRAAVISDDAVFALYGAAAEKALTDAGFQVDHFLFPHGEQQKNLSTYGQVLNFLCDRRFTRSDFLVALGGGVVGAIFFAVVFLIGHSMNMAINLLGAYVHTNRLQFVEFFGKFYEGGGRAYAPFAANTKHFQIKEEK